MELGEALELANMPELPRLGIRLLQLWKPRSPTVTFPEQVDA